MKKPELLMPAGNKEKLEYAIRYGADAVYLGLGDFSLRSMRKGEIITTENLKSSIDLAHGLGAKAYLTLNIFAFNEDIKLLEQNFEVISDAKPDAIIFSDFGIYNVVKKYMPNAEFHVSTQTNILNYEAVKFWRDMGATRAILARELSIPEIAEIKAKVPDMELEVFVHGAQCVSFSGRCLLSDYMTRGERKANHGGCAQACRWSYKLVEKTRPIEPMEIEEDERGTHILSTKDLNLVEYLPQLIDAGVDSFKVEGRTKSLYYVSAVAKAYREAIDRYCDGGVTECRDLYDELRKVGNRGYTQGFYVGKPESDGYSYDISKGLAGADFLCEFRGRDESDESKFFVKIKNKMLLGDEVEIITPKEKFTSKVTAVFDKNGEAMEVANTNDEVFLSFSHAPSDYMYAIARTVGIKNDSGCECVLGGCAE